jgi:asparagine synthase (glutamine-hydrolysing)
MCGILGYVRFDGAVDDATARAFDGARDKLLHRGPDDAATWRSPDGSCLLGFRRLSIIDLSADGRQPMANEDGTLRLVFNGEIYNYRALRRELVDRGHRFRSQADSEVILHLYEEMGPGCLERLDGMFAFAVYDGRDGSIFVARDRLGIKPLYYASSGRRFAFASEPKALLALPDVSREPDLGAVPLYLTFNALPGPGTLFQEIRKLGPGHWMRFGSDGDSRHERYWSPFETQGFAESSDDALEQLPRRLEEAVAKRLVADVPVGAMLSGGLDSSLVVALMARASSEPVRTLTVGYRGGEDERTGDLHYARLVAETFGTRHEELIVEETDILDTMDLLPGLADDPVGAPSVAANLMAARLVRERGVVVTLVGEGGDETFLGYPQTWRTWTLGRRLGFLASRIPRAAARALPDLLPEKLAGFSPSNAMDATLAELLHRYGHGRRAYWGHGTLSTHRERHRLRESHAADHDPHATLLARLGEEEERLRAEGRELDRLMLTDIAVGLAERLLMRVDRATMAFSVEARVPLLDPAVVRTVQRIDPERRGRKPKALLEEIARPILPGPVLERPKAGFPTARGVFLAPGPYGRIRDSVLDERFLAATRLRPTAVRETLDRGRDGQSRHFYQTWALYVLSLWYHRWVENRT